MTRRRVVVAVLDPYQRIDAPFWELTDSQLDAIERDAQFEYRLGDHRTMANLRQTIHKAILAATQPEAFPPCDEARSSP
jgi:hypothetical protein